MIATRMHFYSLPRLSRNVSTFSDNVSENYRFAAPLFLDFSRRSCRLGSPIRRRGRLRSPFFGFVSRGASLLIVMAGDRMRNRLIFFSAEAAAAGSTKKDKENANAPASRVQSSSVIRIEGIRGFDGRVCREAVGTSKFVIISQQKKASTYRKKRREDHGLDSTMTAGQKRRRDL